MRAANKKSGLTQIAQKDNRISDLPVDPYGTRRLGTIYPKGGGCGERRYGGFENQSVDFTCSPTGPCGTA